MQEIDGHYDLALIGPPNITNGGDHSPKYVGNVALGWRLAHTA